MRHHSSTTYATGGPGESGVSFIHHNGPVFQELLGQEYDIVSWDPRYVSLIWPSRASSSPSSIISKGRRADNTPSEFLPGQHRRRCIPHEAPRRPFGEYYRRCSRQNSRTLEYPQQYCRGKDEALIPICHYGAGGTRHAQYRPLFWAREAAILGVFVRGLLAMSGVYRLIETSCRYGTFLGAT